MPSVLFSEQATGSFTALTFSPYDVHVYGSFTFHLCRCGNFGATADKREWESTWHVR